LSQLPGLRSAPEIRTQIHNAGFFSGEKILFVLASSVHLDFKQTQHNPKAKEGIEK